MLDFDLAELYNIGTKVLNQAVTRNGERFSKDFCFRLSANEVQELNRSQSVTGSQKHRDPHYPPRAFTEQGVAMLSSVLRSKRGAQVNVAIMRVFVRMRQMLATNEELARKVAQHDRQITVLFDHVKDCSSHPSAARSAQSGLCTPERSCRVAYCAAG